MEIYIIDNLVNSNLCAVHDTGVYVKFDLSEMSWSTI